MRLLRTLPRGPFLKIVQAAEHRNFVDVCRRAAAPQRRTVRQTLKASRRKIGEIKMLPSISYGEFSFLNEVFTPTLPAHRTFIERDQVNPKVATALQVPGRQIILYGMNYVGKTTLIERNLERYSEDHIVTQCHKGMNFHAVLVNAFDALNAYYTSEKIESKAVGLRLQLQQQFLGIKAALDSYHRSDITLKQERILHPQLTPQNLIKFLGEAKCCWILDDLHKIEKSEREHIADIMKLFIDKTMQYPDTRMIVVGAVSTAEELLPSTVELRGRIAEIHVPLMTDEEVLNIIKKGETLLNIEFTPKVREFVVNISSGLPILCHELCLQLCYAANVQWTTESLKIIDDEHFKSAILSFIENTLEDVKAKYSIALKSNQHKRYHHALLIVDALSRTKKDGGTKLELMKKIAENEPNYKMEYLIRHLSSLAAEDDGCLLRFDRAADRFVFKHPTERAYAVANLYARNLGLL